MQSAGGAGGGAGGAGQPGLPRLRNVTPSVRPSLGCRNVNVAFCFTTDYVVGLDQRKEREREFAVGKLHSRRKIWRLVCSLAWGNPLALVGGCPEKGQLEILSLKDLR